MHKGRVALTNFTTDLYDSDRFYTNDELSINLNEDMIYWDEINDK